MAIGGFNGTDPWPTLAAFQQYVADGKIHYFIAGGGGGGPGGGSGTASSADRQLGRGQLHRHHHRRDHRLRPHELIVSASSKERRAVLTVTDRKLFDRHPAWHRRAVDVAWSCATELALFAEISDKSVLIVRSSPDNTRAFWSSCRHRGRQLLPDPAYVQRLRCPFHGFTWDLDGSLAFSPSEWDFPQIDKRRLGLGQRRPRHLPRPSSSATPRLDVAGAVDRRCGESRQSDAPTTSQATRW